MLFLWIYVKEIQESIEIAPNVQNWNNLSNKIYEVVLDGNPKYKINIHALIMTEKYLIRK